MDIESFVKSAFAPLGATELLAAPIDALHGTGAAQTTALATVLGLRTVFDLGASQLLHTLRSALASPAPRLGGDVLDAVALGSLALADAPLSTLRAVGSAGAGALNTALGVATLGELAAWPPGLAARDLLAAACTPEQAPGFDPDAPADLVPRVGEHATDKVFYKSLLIDSVAPPPGAPGTVAIESSDPVDLGAALGGGTQFQRVATGALLSFSQSWFPQGVTLGQLLHSLSLAPGESTRMAMIDWSRQSSGRGSEAVDESERLANTTTHQRALSEVTEATATEVQGGRTKTTSSSSTSQDGSALGFELGPIAFGGSSGSSNTGTEAMTVSSSFGRRNVAASVAQQINDVSQQQASNSRSRRASVVREVSQTEHEALSTRVICNYNHMHTLNVQYYEVVQAFRVTTRLERAERVIFVPMKLLDFGDVAVIERHRAVLAEAALDPATRQRLALLGTVLLRSRRPRRIKLGAAFTAVAAAVRNAVAVAAPAAGPAPSPAPAEAAPPSVASTARVNLLQRFAGDGWDGEQLKALVRIGVRPLATVFETALAMPADTLVSAISLPTELALSFEITRNDGSTVPLVDPSASGARFVAPESMRELAAISIRSSSIVAQETTLTLQLNLQGTVGAVGVPLTLQPGGPLSALQRALSFEAQGELDELQSHLSANALHYTQAVLGRLDPALLSSLLARLSFGGVPLAQWVDHKPVAVAANFLVFRAGLPERGDSPDPALATLTTAWQQFLATAGLNESPPRQELMLMPTGGVFAEAVLGRSNSAERLDGTRFFDWQESPIPLVASEIAPLEAGSRADDENLQPTDLSAPVINIQTPTALPDPTGINAVLGALGAANLFRDLSGAQQTVALAQALQKVGAAGATSGGAIAGQTLKTVMEQNTERLRVAAKVAAAVAGVPTAGGDGKTGGKAGTASGSNTTDGGLVNRAKDIDASKAQAGSPSSGDGGATARPEATALQQRQSGVDAISGVGQIVRSVQQGQQGSEGGTSTLQATKSAPRGPRKVSAELRTSDTLRNAGFFDNAPVTVELDLKERDGTRILQRANLAAGGQEQFEFSTASPTLSAQLSVVVDTSWPVPTRQVNVLSASIDLGAVKSTMRLQLTAEVTPKTQVVGTGATAPTDAQVVGALSQLGINTRQVLKRPVVAKNAAGEFVASFPQLTALRFAFVPD